ncbi:MAG: hypothetical protein IH804_04450 [Planctomycetes bacterium]|nr:hypothetical protein [Planctomycetota bacterium]
MLAWVCDARDGAPIPGARVHLWTMRYLNQRYTGSDTIARTDHEGLARFEVDASTRPRESDHGFIVTASVEGRQAFGLGPRSSTASQHESWKIYTVTDRPAYRPGETVHFKITARTNDGSGYATPAGEVVGYEITGPRGKVDQGQLPLNVFGSAWSELALSESMTLGEYQITFYNEGRRRTIGSAKLFRLEEYKLPEFTVNVGTPVDELGRPKTFRLGDRVEAQVQASYYFGGPVANANVELLVYQKAFHHFWMPPRQYPWYYAHRRHHDYWGGQGQIIQRKTLKTDGAGRVTISFETPVGGSQDFQYTIEARVTDASRREIVGTGTVRVTRQSYYVYPRPRRNVVGPGETVEVDFKSLDPNDEPLAVEGRVTVTRDRWVEVWLNPADREVTGSALARARRRLEVFPPPAKGGERPWRLKFRGYTSQEILTRTIKTSDEGEATLVFAAHDEGYYRIRWRSEDPASRAAGSAPILAETTVWVADHATSELGYRSDGVQIIIDADTFRAGETAAVMLSVPTNDRYVLFAVEGNDMHSYRVVHVTGTVKLIQLPLEQRHIPNVYLQAHMVSDGRLYSDRKEVVVPPVGNFLDLEVRADRDSYEPRDEGTLTVVTRDADGKPVPAEVSLSLVDESVFYIQSEYAADPREFFFNDRQGLVVHTASTFSRKRYVRLVKTDTEVFIDARLAGGVGDEGDRNQLGMDHLRSGARRARGIAGAYAEGPAEKMMLLEASDDMEPGPMAQATGAAAPFKKPTGPGGGGEPAVVVRSDFRSTILWEPNLVTGTDGTATVRVKYADSLTRWKATARAATTGSRFGIGTTTTRTRRPLIARLQAPRFFVVGDTVTLSGVFNNNTDEPLTVEPLLEVTGLKITGILQGGRPVSATAGAVRVPAGGERRVDWVAVVEKPGQAKVRLTARSGGHADAMEKTYAVYEHGVEKLIASSGKVRGESVTVKLQIPARRKAGSRECPSTTRLGSTSPVST